MPNYPPIVKHTSKYFNEIITQFNFIGQGGAVAVDTKELAEKTYKDLQKRKALKAKKKETEFLDYVTKRQKEKKRNVKTWYGKRIH